MRCWRNGLPLKPPHNPGRPLTFCPSGLVSGPQQRTDNFVATFEMPDQISCAVCTPRIWDFCNLISLTETCVERGNNDIVINTYPGGPKVRPQPLCQSQARCYQQKQATSKGPRFGTQASVPGIANHCSVRIAVCVGEIIISETFYEAKVNFINYGNHKNQSNSDILDAMRRCG